MKILVLDKLAEPLLLELLSDNVCYRPDLLRRHPSLLRATITSAGIEAVVSQFAPPAGVSTNRKSKQKLLWIRVTVGEVSKSATPLDPQPGCDELTVVSVAAPGDDAAYLAAFDEIERRSAGRIFTKPGVLHTVPSSRSADRRVVMIGAGLVNLITAATLQEEGFNVHCFDGGPDPRSAASWAQYGCSRGGDDARMFTLTEMDNYNDKANSSDMNTIFDRDVSASGWSAHKSPTLSNRESEWVQQFRSIPVWLAKRFNDDIFSFNRESLPLWTDWMRDDPTLFTSSHLREGILRIYSDKTHFESALARQNRVGATQKVLTPEMVAKEFPALGDAVCAGLIAGGVVVVGFTVNAHKFMHRLLDKLERGGAKFAWSHRAQKLVFDAQHRISGVKLVDNVVTAPHYVISLGTYGRMLLAGTRSQFKIHGVLGAWLRIPNLEPRLDISLKLGRKSHTTEDANITVATDEAGEPILIIGSGYGHTGIDPNNIDRSVLYQIYAGLDDTAEKYFPRGYAASRAKGNLEASLKYCVRPWTATGLGLFEMIGTSQGGRCVITGGHNTGGFAQGPSIAKAVHAALMHNEHPMHASYHPDRASSFLEALPPVASGDEPPELLENAV